jgi:DNA repair protein RecN (Recombination protein N)
MPAIDLLNDAQRELNKISSYGENYEDLSKRLNSAIIEISDIAESVADELSSFEFSQSDLDAVEKRLDVIRNVTSKYGKYSAIMAFKDELIRKIDEIENADEYYSKLISEKKQVIKLLYELSCDLSNERKTAAKSLEKLVMSELNELGMERSVFEVKFASLPNLDDCETKLSAKGMDEVEFYLCPNEGQPLLPLVKIISGGELSRLMLALKVVSSGVDETATVIFDEIDTGISGKVGQEIAKKLARLSRDKQLLCVTHLPQIASMADEHFFIDKKSLDGKTVTVVKTLTDDEKVDEIARLSGAKDISEGATENARQMKVWSNEYKSSL